MLSWTMSCRRAVGAAWMLALSGAGAVALAYPASAFACPPPQSEQLLCVQFRMDSLAVPLSDDTTLAIGIVLAFSALLMLRRRARTGPRLWLWMLVVGLLAPALEPVGDAGAVPPPPVPLELGTSPAQLTIVNTTGSPNPYYVQVSNPHRLPVTIFAITLMPGTNPPPSYAIWPPGTTCAVGMKLLAGGTCTIELVKPLPA